MKAASAKQSKHPESFTVLWSALIVEHAFHNRHHRVRGAGGGEDFFPEAGLLVSDDEHRQMVFLLVDLLPEPESAKSTFSFVPVRNSQPGFAWKRSA